jgi:putative chitinase
MMLTTCSTGPLVRKLQNRLNVTESGIYDSETSYAVVEFQKSNNLTPDNIVGKQTWDLLFPIATLAKNEETKDTKTPTSNNTATDRLFDKLYDYIPANFLVELHNVSQKYGITTPLRIAHFLSQCSEESVNFTAVEENLNYRAEGLTLTFKKHFKNLAEMEQYAHKPEKIANRVYAFRYGNGSEASGDGWKYRGRGLIETTFKSNYRRFFKYMGLPEDSDPDLLATTYPIESAIFFFNDNNIWPICDKGGSVATITEVTKRVNGGTNGLNKRVEIFNILYKVLIS